VSYSSTGAEVSESFLNFRARIDGFHSQNTKEPPRADLTNAKAELEAMKARGFSDMSAVLQNKGKNLKITGSACEADIFAQGLGHPMGFGSRALLVANEIQVAGVFGLSITVCGGEFAQDTWAKHFQNLAGISMCDSEMCSSDAPGVSEAAILGNDMSKDLSLVDAEALYELKHMIFLRMFTYNTASKTAVDKILQAVPLDTQKPYVGVHIRRGDKEEEAAQTPMPAYATALLEQMDNLGIRTVFVASDDPNAGSELAKEFADTGHPDVEVLQQHQAPPIVAEGGIREYSDDDGTMNLLADIEGLRLAKVFIGTQTSSLGRIAFYLRGEMTSSISLDGDWFDFTWL